MSQSFTLLEELFHDVLTPDLAQGEASGRIADVSSLDSNLQTDKPGSLQSNRGVVLMVPHHCVFGDWSIACVH